MVNTKMMLVAKDNVDIIEAIKQMKDGAAEQCDINMHDFEESDEGGLKILMKFRKYIRESDLDIRFISFNGTLPKIRDYLKKCNSTK